MQPAEFTSNIEKKRVNSKNSFSSKNSSNQIGGLKQKVINKSPTINKVKKLNLFKTKNFSKMEHNLKRIIDNSSSQRSKETDFSESKLSMSKKLNKSRNKTKSPSKYAIDIIGVETGQKFYNKLRKQYTNVMNSPSFNIINSCREKNQEIEINEESLYLTKIPKISSKKGEIGDSYYTIQKARRSAILMRRIEYNSKITNNLKFKVYNIEMIIRIQNAWRLYIKTNRLKKYILIQKILKGHIFRRKFHRLRKIYENLIKIKNKFMKPIFKLLQKVKKMTVLKDNKFKFKIDNNFQINFINDKIRDQKGIIKEIDIFQGEGLLLSGIKTFPRPLAEIGELSSITKSRFLKMKNKNPKSKFYICNENKVNILSSNLILEKYSNTLMNIDKDNILKKPINHNPMFLTKINKVSKVKPNLRKKGKDFKFLTKILIIAIITILKTFAKRELFRILLELFYFPDNKIKDVELKKTIENKIKRKTSSNIAIFQKVVTKNKVNRENSSSKLKTTTSNFSKSQKDKTQNSNKIKNSEKD